MYEAIEGNLGAENKQANFNRIVSAGKTIIKPEFGSNLSKEIELINPDSDMKLIYPKLKIATDMEKGIILLIKNPEVRLAIFSYGNMKRSKSATILTRSVAVSPQYYSLGIGTALVVLGHELLTALTPNFAKDCENVYAVSLDSSRNFKKKNDNKRPHWTTSILSQLGYQPYVQAEFSDPALETYFMSEKSTTSLNWLVKKLA